MVLACYRIEHDHWTNARAMAEAPRLGFNRFEVLLRRYIAHFDIARVCFSAPQFRWCRARSGVE